MSLYGVASTLLFEECMVWSVALYSGSDRVGFLLGQIIRYHGTSAYRILLAIGLLSRLEPIPSQICPSSTEEPVLLIGESHLAW